MPTLTIRNVDSNVHSFLRQQAAEHGCSMEAEVRGILAHTMRRQQTNPGEVARRIHAHFAKIGGGDDIPLPERDPSPQPMTFEE